MYEEQIAAMKHVVDKLETEDPRNQDGSLDTPYILPEFTFDEYRLIVIALNGHIQVLTQLEQGQVFGVRVQRQNPNLEDKHYE
jgi:hypothetical protein